MKTWKKISPKQSLVLGDYHKGSNIVMGYAPTVWRLKLLEEPSGRIRHPSNYEGMTVWIIHDHTSARRQNTYLAISGKLSHDYTYRAAHSIAKDRGFQVKPDVADISRIFLQEYSAKTKEGKIETYYNRFRYWRACKAVFDVKTSKLNTSIQKISPLEQDEDGNIPPPPEPEESEKPESDVDPSSLDFPHPFHGVVIAARPNGDTWTTRMWSYGEDKHTVRQLIKLYGKSLSGATDAKPVKRGMFKSLMASAGVFFCLSVLGMIGGYENNSASFASLFLTLSCCSLGASLVSFFNCPYRIDIRAGYPRRIRKMLHAGKWWGWGNISRRKGQIFEIPKQKPLSRWLNVTRNNEIFPDIGGVMIGSSSDKYPMRIPDSERYRNLVFCGAPGVGKSTAMLWAAGGDITRMHKGEDHTLIWLEYKSDAGERLCEMSSKIGIEPIYISPGSTEGKQLRFLEWDNTKAAAGALTEALTASFEKQSIQEQSRDVFAALFDMSANIWPEMLKLAGDHEPPNLMRTAWILAGGNRWDATKQLLESAEAKTANKELFKQARERLGIYLDVNDREKDRIFAPARNKLNRLKDLPAWDLDYTRTGYSWLDIISCNRPVIIDISTYSSPGLESYSEELARILLPISLFTFWSVAQKHCARWGEEKKSVALYCDEASNLQYNAGEILNSMSDKGRSHGISLVLGAQGWTHLSEGAQRTFRQAGHKFLFQSPDAISAAAVAENFASKGYTANALMRMAPYEAMSQVTIDGELFGPLIVNIEPENKWTPHNSWSPIGINPSSNGYMPLDELEFADA